MYEEWSMYEDIMRGINEGMESVSIESVSIEDCHINDNKNSISTNNYCRMTTGNTLTPRRITTTSQIFLYS